MKGTIPTLRLNLYSSLLTCGSHLSRATSWAAHSQWEAVMSSGGLEREVV